jgi:hypothetical protein
MMFGEPNGRKKDLSDTVFNNVNLDKMIKLNIQW